MYFSNKEKQCKTKNDKAIKTKYYINKTTNPTRTANDTYAYMTPVIMLIVSITFVISLT